MNKFWVLPYYVWEFLYTGGVIGWIKPRDYVKYLADRNSLENAKMVGAVFYAAFLFGGYIAYDLNRGDDPVPVTAAQMVENPVVSRDGEMWQDLVSGQFHLVYHGQDWIRADGLKRAEWEAYQKGVNSALVRIALYHLEVQLQGERKSFGELSDTVRARLGVVKDE